MEESNKKSKHKLLRKYNPVDVTIHDNLDAVYEAYRVLMERIRSVDLTEWVYIEE